MQLDHFLSAIQDQSPLLITLPTATKEEGPTSILTIFNMSFACNMLSPAVVLVYYHVTVIVFN